MPQLKPWPASILFLPLRRHDIHDCTDATALQVELPSSKLSSAEVRDRDIHDRLCDAIHAELGDRILALPVNDTKKAIYRKSPIRAFRDKLRHTGQAADFLISATSIWLSPDEYGSSAVRPAPILELLRTFRCRARIAHGLREPNIDQRTVMRKLRLVG